MKPALALTLFLLMLLPLQAMAAPFQKDSVQMETAIKASEPVVESKPNQEVPKQSSPAPSMNVAPVNIPNVTVSAGDPAAKEFNTHWGILVPIKGFLFLGDKPEACTDEKMGNLAYGHDHVLKVCMGSARDWMPFVMTDKASL